MKRILICAALLCCVAACAAPTAPDNAAGNAANGNNAATPAASGTPANASTASANDAVITQEKQVWDAIRNRQFDNFASMLADEQIYVSSDGAHDKAETVKQVSQLTLTDVSMSDWKVVNLDKEAAVVTYTMTAKGTVGGQQIPGTPSRATTAWVKRGGKWQAIYHQDTDVMPPQPASSPAASASPQARTSASPASSPPQASGTAFDVKLKEQQVWDALRRHDFDAFASFLSDDFIEVEPDSVTDKAGSVKGVQGVNFNGAVLSDFRVINLDKDFSNDVSIVTYLVKGSAEAWGPSGMRHTSIWTYRDGKWAASFHQGTPQMKQTK